MKILIFTSILFSLFDKSCSQKAITIDDIYNETVDHIDDPNQVRCYGFYGCFPINEPWKCKERAFNVFPFSPSVINVQFPLFTNNTRESPTLIDLNNPETIYSANISKNQLIFIITHGFVEMGNAPWMIEMMNELLDFDNNAAVILVDWRGGSTFPYYQAVANTRVVGAVLAHTIMEIFFLIKMESLEKFHLIGHSLGAHVSGYAGYYLQRDFNFKVGRITGLDPAKPYFEFTNPIVRLDPSDAAFVDIVHTDSGLFMKNSFGLKQAIGHIDFYLNGGEIQPSCNKSILELTCHHKAAYIYFIESINTKCKFKALSCDSYEDFSNGSCKINKNSFTFGFHSYQSYQNAFNVVEKFKNFTFPKADKKPKVKAYLNTAASSPFCQSHARISLKIANREGQGVEIGRIRIAIVGNEGKSQAVELNKKAQEFKAGEMKIFMINYSFVGDEIKSVKIEFFYDLAIIGIYQPELYVEFLEIQSIDGKIYKMCPFNGKPLIHHKVDEFKENFCGEKLNNVVIN